MTRPRLFHPTRLVRALAAAAAVWAAGCAPREGPSWAETTLASLSPRARAAQLVVVPLRAAGEPGADSVGGVWLAEGSAPDFAALRRLQGSAPVPLLVAAEVDGGAAALAPGATPFPALPLLALAGDAAVAGAAGEHTAREARALGIHLGVVTLPAVGADPAASLLPVPGEEAAEAVAAYVEGMREGGLLPAVRALHPGGAPPVLRWDRARLEAVELPLLRAAVEEEAGAVLLPALSLPALTGDSLPLALSPVAVRGLLRRDLGFGGVVAVDLRPGAPLARRHGVAEAAVLAVAAGADLLLGVSAPGEVTDALLRAVAEGRIPRARLDEAARRVLEAKERAGLASPPADAPARLRAPGALEAARRAAEAVEGVRRHPSLLPVPAPVLRVVAPESVGMSGEALARADRVIREAVREGVFPGAALAVGRRGGVVRLRGYGELDGGEEVDARETLYDVASLSKVLGTTAAAMALVDEGKLRLDAPVRRYLPGFRGKWKGDVTVRHLLTHTSGLPAGDWLYGSARSPGQALEQALEVDLVRPPGERMVYSDFGFILLAEVVEQTAGEPLDRYLARRVLAPLGMSSTQYLPPRVLYPQTAPTARRTEREYVLRGVVHDANAFRLGGVAGHAGLFSTARDVAVFAQALLNGGSYGTRRLWSPEVVRRFAADQPQEGRRGLGWDKPADRSSAGSYFSARSFGHTGYTGTSLWIDPETELFVVLLTNRTYTEGTSREMLQVRADVHDAVARAITDTTVRPRPGSPAALEEERARRARQRPRRGRRG